MDEKTFILIAASGIKAKAEIMDFYGKSSRNCIASESEGLRECRRMVAGVNPLFFKDLADKAGVGISSVVSLFKDSRVVRLFNSFKWDFSKLYDLLRTGYKAMIDLKSALKEYAEQSGIGRWTARELDSQRLRDIDLWLKNHSKARRISGVVVGAMLVYIWFNMSFVGHPGFDFDMSDMLSALKGNFSLEKIFSGASGAALLLLFLVGLSGFTFPWPGPASVKFILAIVGTIAIKLGKKLKKEKNVMAANNDIDELEKKLEKGVEKSDRLSGVDPAYAKFLVRSGLDDGEPSDGRVPVRKATISASKLKPSQKTIKLWGVIGIALMMLRKGKVGGDLGALISKDKHILDGHHRWAAAILAGGDKTKVGGYVAGLEGKDLMRVLNIVTKGEFHRNRGNSGTGDLKDVNPKMVREFLEDYVENGLKGEYPVSAESVRATLEGAFGSVEEGIEIMSANANKVSKSIPGWAPDRTDMPVIEPEETPGVETMLNQGLVNWRRPFVDRNSPDLSIPNIAMEILKVAREIATDDERS